MDKKIVVISEYFYPDERTDAFLLTEITKKLSEVNDGNIEVICTSELNSSEELEFLKGKIVRLKKSKLNENNILLRIIKFLSLTFKLSLKAFFTIKKNDRVFLTTNPAFLIPVISIFRIFKTFEYTLLVYDVFPENISAAKIISKNSLFYKIIKKIYDWSYSKADRLIVIGRDMQEVILEKTNHTKPTYLIENWCNYESVKPESKFENSILKKLGIEKKKVFLFAGTLGRVQGIDTLLKASKLVKDKDFVLLFIGDGAYKNEVVKFTSDRDNLNVYYAGSFPISKQNEFLNACDISIISLAKEMYGLGVPSKSYYNMSAQKPLLYIGEKNSEISLVIDEYNLGWTIEPNNEKKLALLIDEICKKDDEYLFIGKTSREVVKRYFSKDIILNKYAKLYAGTK